MALMIVYDTPGAQLSVFLPSPEDETMGFLVFKIPDVGQSPESQ
jgi:hypothetical protein